MSDNLKRNCNEMEEVKQKVLKCEICNVTVTSKICYDQHLLGSKHKKLFASKEVKQRVDQTCAPFVRAVDNFEEETDKLLPCLIAIKSLEMQVNMLQNHLQDNVLALLTKRDGICQDLYNILRPVFPTCQIHPFGSTVTGIAFKNSDIDVYISGIRDPAQTDSKPKELFKIKNYLLKSKKFVTTCVIAHAKIPILKCVHRATITNCDINLRSILGVHNSYLIRYYTELDVKIRKILIVLKCWSKRHKITGQNHLFSNYTITLMVIFFLQQSPYNFPSVRELQKNPEFHNFIEFWNSGFQKLKLPENSSISTATLLQLLKEFFTFYATFNFDKNIICPYLGYTIPKDTFKNPDTIPECFDRYIQYIQNTNNRQLKTESVVCLQDPFEHWHNTASVITKTVLEYFVSFCNLGVTICQQEDGLIYKLMIEEPPKLKKSVDKIQISDSLKLTIDVDDKSEEIKPENMKEMQKLLFEKFKNFLLYCLKDIFKFNVEEITENSCKEPKKDNQTDVYDFFQKKYKCTAKLNLWDGRQRFMKNSIDCKTLLEKEKALTEKLCELYKNINNTHNILELEVVIRLIYNPLRVGVCLTKISSYKKIFKSFFMFFEQCFVKWYRVYEQELDI